MVGTSTETGRLVIVEDEVQLLDLMKEFFVGAGFRVKEYSSAEDFLLDLEWMTIVDCVIADVRLPGMDGVQLLQRLTSNYPTIPVVMMTGHGDIPMAVRAIKRGAFDFVEKPFDPERIEEIVRAAVQSRAPKSTRACGIDAEYLVSRLTRRQLEILELIAEGLTSKEIAERLGMSFRTVDTHRARIMERLQVKTLAELLRLQLSLELKK